MAVRAKGILCPIPTNQLCTLNRISLGERAGQAVFKPEFFTRKLRLLEAVIARIRGAGGVVLFHGWRLDTTLYYQLASACGGLATAYPYQGRHISSYIKPAQARDLLGFNYERYYFDLNSSLVDHLRRLLWWGVLIGGRSRSGGQARQRHQLAAGAFYLRQFARLQGQYGWRGRRRYAYWWADLARNGRPPRGYTARRSRYERFRDERREGRAAARRSVEVRRPWLVFLFGGTTDPHFFATVRNVGAVVVVLSVDSPFVEAGDYRLPVLVRTAADLCYWGVQRVALVQRCQRQQAGRQARRGYERRHHAAQRRGQLAARGERV